ncbi:MAG: asparagine synthase-related protein [bacterium]
MSNLCGAWAISGGPIERYLRDSDKNAMLAQLHEGQHGVRQFSGGPLWMAAAAQNLAHDNRACMAMEGFIAFEESGPRNLGELFEWQKSRSAFEVFQNGHYVLVYVDTSKAVLFLLRDPTGGERLFFTRTSDLLLFSSSTRPLLAHSNVPGKLDPETAAEFMINGFILFRSRTLLSGIHEVLPGHLAGPPWDAVKQRRHWKRLLEPPEKNPIDTPRRLRQSLLHATRLAIGEDRQAAVSLSGGLDSLAITACAVELLGPKNVQAFTYEILDPSHPSEVHHASQICRHFGIRHHIVKISCQDFLNAVPEALWRMEDSNYMGPARELIFSQRVKSHGFAKILTGSGMEYILGSFGYSGYLNSVARVLPRLPRPDRTLRFWKLAISPHRRWRILARILARRIHPGLRPPPPALYYLILCVLQHNGIIRDISVFYPPALREVVRRTVLSPHVREAIQSFDGAPLRVQLQYLYYYGYGLCYTAVLRSIRMTRAAGLSMAAPAMFMCSDCLSAIFHRRSSPTRMLLQEAMKDRIPETFLHRPAKMPPPVPASWFSEIARFSAPLVPQSRNYLLSCYFKEFDEARGYFDDSLASFTELYVPFGDRNMNMLALWHRCHIELPLMSAPPDWADLSEKKFMERSAI